MMAKSYDSKTKRTEIKELRGKIETKKGELSKLEEQKKELLDAVTDVYGAKVDEKTKQQVHAAINRSLEANSNKGKEISREMNTELSSLENIRQETQESMNETNDQKKKIERKQKLLERFGLGGSLDSAVSELNNNIQELGELDREAIEAMSEAEKVSQKLGML